MASSTQLDLELDIGIKSLAELRLSERGIEEPVVWVERLEVHKETPSGVGSLMRRIQLRKGLNILWATSSGDDSARLGGHGAGKTTFCRLLRFAIGDSTPGNRQFRDAFRSRFPNGWILADVWVSGERWLIARPLGEVGHHPWASKGSTLLEPLPKPADRQSFRDYEEAIQAATFGKMKTRELSSSGRSVDWSLLLPWLSRDQEAHYASLIEWRAKESDSDSDSLSAVDRENLMRLVLGLVDPDEQERLREREQISQEHERLIRERPQKEYHRQKTKSAFEALFDGHIGHPGDLVFESEIQKAISGLRNEADTALVSLQEDPDLKKLVSEEAARKLEMEFVASRVGELELAVAQQKGTVQATSHQASDASHLAGTTRFFPFKGYCSTPLQIARRNHCPCITARPEDDEIEKATEDILSTAGKERTRLQELQEQLDFLNRDLDQREAAYESAKTATDALRTVNRAKIEEIYTPRNKAAALEAAYDAYVSAEQTVNETAEKLEDLKRKKADLDKAIEEHAKGHRAVMDAFGDLFNAIVKAMLGTEVTGRIDFAGGKTIEPKLEFHGSFDSAALSLAKLLAFDLAALAFSLFENRGHHPRFLLHDSPRESDLAAPIYSSFFLAVKAIEEACRDTIGFQYIVTTTEPPPKAVNKAPWVIDPILDATQAEKRFLGVDL